MFKTNRLQIRKFKSLNDVKLFVTLYNDLKERSIHDHLEVTNLEEKISKFKNTGFDDDKNTHYIIYDENNNFIGTIGYKRESDFELTLGYRILKHEYRQLGYMSEALESFVEYIFKYKKDVQRLSLYIHSENVGSKKIAEKYGFSYEGSMREAYKYRGKTVDFEIYSLLRKEYKESL